MIEVNEYYEGTVKSFVLNTAAGKKTIGVMEPGEYEFDTTSPETMTIIEGSLEVYFPADDEWEEFEAGASFDVAGESKLKVKVTEPTAYVCVYG